MEGSNENTRGTWRYDASKRLLPHPTTKHPAGTRKRSETSGMAETSRQKASRPRVSSVASCEISIQSRPFSGLSDGAELSLRGGKSSTGTSGPQPRKFALFGEGETEARKSRRPTLHPVPTTL